MFLVGMWGWWVVVASAPRYELTTDNSGILAELLIFSCDISLLKEQMVFSKRLVQVT
jgi:hypothetical protein